MKYYRGLEQVAKGYRDCLEGKIEPDTAIIMSLWDPSEENSHPELSKL